jgi:AraC-like DNA-binding protein
MFTARPNLSDPFIDLIHLLRPRATVFCGIDGFGGWGLSIRQKPELLFCWIERGECQLMVPRLAPLHLRQDDFVLIRGFTPITITTDPETEPIDNETIVAAPDARLKLGAGTDKPLTLHAGRFLFDTANEDLLTGMLPSIIHVTAADTTSWRVRSLLKMNETEYQEPRPGGEFFIVRLMELILVDILRNEGGQVKEQHSGLLAGLADPITARALTAMHRTVAHPWTVAELAQLCGVSRSKFASRFQKIVGMGPIEYLLHWRMALAKDELRNGVLSIGEIALAVGFQSTSAFSTAFTRVVGCSPKRFAVLVDRNPTTLA